jgi:hypothetical protein
MCVPKCLAAILAAVLLCANFAGANSLDKILYSFPGGSDGASPIGTMIFDNAGNLFGLAGGGGANNNGVVFKLTPSGTGGWTESVIYNFLYPNYPGSTLIFDSSGNLYGTFPGGGSAGCGAIYQLTPEQLAPQPGGHWTENILFSFPCETKGAYPVGLAFDPVTGNLYGTASSGGTVNDGTFFELTPVVGGGWSFSVIHTFGFGYDGKSPNGPLTLDSAGNIYGTTNLGGNYNNGTVFKLTHGTNGWMGKVLYDFTGGDNGAYPLAGVIFDQQGNLYGSTQQGGDDDVGVVYQLTPTKGKWSIQVIHNFTGGLDGGNPTSFNLAIDSAGNLYGETLFGGLYGYGNAYELTPTTGGEWTETTLHSFADTSDGEYPEGGLTLNSSGKLFGTAGGGGIDGYGVVFEIKP